MPIITPSPVLISKSDICVVYSSIYLFIHPSIICQST